MLITTRTRRCVLLRNVVHIGSFYVLLAKRASIIGDVRLLSSAKEMTPGSRRNELRACNVGDYRLVTFGNQTIAENLTKIAHTSARSQDRLERLDDIALVAIVHKQY